MHTCSTISSPSSLAWCAQPCNHHCGCTRFAATAQAQSNIFNNILFSFLFGFLFVVDFLCWRCCVILITILRDWIVWNCHTNGGVGGGGIQAYTAWVNSQLRKRPELPLIDDMGNDLQDGVLVAKLIEIISKLHIFYFTFFLFPFSFFYYFI